MSDETPVPTRMTREAFVARFGGIVEHSPWVAERAFDAGLPGEADRAEGLARVLNETLMAASDEEKLSVLRTHPELAGRLARQGGLTGKSSGEQASAGLDRITAEEQARIERLNAAYRERFGFPFILAVKGRTKREILDAMETRVRNAPAVELQTALVEVETIVRLRLADLLP